MWFYYGLCGFNIFLNLKPMVKSFRIIGVLSLLILLVLVKVFESSIFYDPLITYFKNDYLYQQVPVLEVGDLMFFYSIRFWMNTLLSISILKLIFINKDYWKDVLPLYLIGYLVMLGLLYILLQSQANYLVLFYVRRFIIHPIFLLLLVVYYYLESRLNV